jgi:hypothetical protein
LYFPLASLSVFLIYLETFQIGGLLFFSLAAYMGIRFRRPKWTALQQAGIITCLGFTGYTLGKLNMVKAHTHFLRSIENPRGFSTAMRNIESRTGLQNHLTGGLKFTTVLEDEDGKEISHERELILSHCHFPIVTSYLADRSNLHNLTWKSTREARRKFKTDGEGPFQMG